MGKFKLNWIESDDGVLCFDITVNKFRELSPLGLYHWSICDYMASWRSNLQRLVEHKQDCALVAGYYGLDSNPVFNLYPMYYLGDIVAVRNNLIFADSVHGNSCVDAPWELLKGRNDEDQDVNEDELKPCEWQVDFSSRVKQEHGTPFWYLHY